MGLGVAILCPALRARSLSEYACDLHPILRQDTTAHTYGEGKGLF